VTSDAIRSDIFRGLLFLLVAETVSDTFSSPNQYNMQPFRITWSLGLLPMNRTSLARSAISVLLCVAGAGKIVSVFFVGEQNANSLYIASVELFLAFGLLSSNSRTQNLFWLYSAWLSLLFLAIAGLRAASGGAVACDCLGYFTLSWLPHYAMALVFGLLVLLASPGQQSLHEWQYRKSSKLAAGCFACIIFASTISANRDASEGLQRVLFRPAVSVRGGNRIDVGRVLANTVCNTQFSIINESNSVVRILGTRQSCTCARVKSHPSEIEPGKESEVVVEFNSPNEFGRHSVDVMLHLDVSTQFEVRASLEYEVVATASGASLQPRVLGNLGRMVYQCPKGGQ